MMEAITVPDRRDLRRINLKSAALQVSLNLPVITILVYLQRGDYANFPAGYDDEIASLSNSHRFARLLLWEHEARIRSGELKELAPFLPLFEDEPNPRILEIENDLLNTISDPQQRIELKSLGAIIAARQFGEELIKQYLNLEFPMIRETTIFTEWLNQKFDEGRAEGRNEGRNEGKRLVVQTQLVKKFGRLPQDLKDALEHLSGDKLDSLSTALFDLESVNDLRAWLAEPQHHLKNL